MPGTIFVGHYDEGGEGVAYHDTSKGNKTSKTWRTEEDVDCNEHSVGTLTSGEWLQYTVDVAKSAVYRISFTYGTPYPGPHMVVFLCDGVEVGRMTLPKHGFDDWRVTSRQSTEVRLPAGRHALTVLTLGLFNYNDIVIEAM